VKVARWQSAFVVQAQALFQLRLASLAYSKQWIVFYYSKGLTPHLQPVSGAPFFGIKNRYATRVLDCDNRNRKEYDKARNRRNHDTAAAAGQRHHRHSSSQSGECRAR